MTPMNREVTLEPMTRVELFLAAIAGEDYTTPDPMTRIEVYLDCIEKGTAATLVPMTRIELYLAKISGADVDIPPYPMTRIEMFLAALCDEDITPPAAMTRIELYLANWIENAGTDVTNTAPYLFRSLPYNAKKKTLNKIVGGSFAWNQLQENGNFESTSNIEAYNGTISASNGVLSYTVSTLSGSSNQIRMPSVSCVDGHKYLFTFAIKPAHSKTNQGVAFLLRTSGSGANIAFGRFNLVGGEWNRIDYIANVNESGTTYGTLQILFNATSDNGYSVGDIDQVKDIMCIDLTRLFGSPIADYIYTLEQGTAGAGVAFFKNLFQKDYYPFDAGSIVSVKTSASKMVGVNLLDGNNIYQGTLVANGSPVNVNTGFIRVLPNTRYYERKLFTTSGAYAYLYNADKTTYTREIKKYSGDYLDFTTDADTAYVRLMWYRSTGITPADVIDADCCLNVYDASINGTYVPYVKSEYALSNTELRGIPKLDANNKLYYDGDEYTADSTVKRKYGIVDLGTLSWTKRNTSTGHWRFSTQDIPIKWNSASDAVGNMVCPRYQSVSASNTWNGITGISSHTTMTQLLVCDETYSDADTFKSAMSGVYLIYELATPTTESATSYTQAQKCYPNGTEEFIDGRTVEVPVGHETVYKAKENT